MPLTQLTSLLPPPEIPVETGSKKQWEQVQERLGLSLPVDYQSFINAYGTGHFSNGMIVYNPFAREDVHNLFQALEVHHQASSHVKKTSSTNWSIVDPFQLYPALGGLLPWGMLIDYKISMFWSLDEDREFWPTVVYDLKRGEYEVWKLGFVDFLTHLLRGEINSVFLSKAITFKRQLIRFSPLHENEINTVTNPG